MDRRKVLSLTSTVGLSSLAGCGGKLKAATRTGPPHFEEVELTGPGEVSVGEEFYLEVSAKNTGGESGDFTNTLSAGEGAFTIDQNVRIEDIGVEESKSAEVGPNYPGYSRDYQFQITDYGASHTVSVTTKTLEGSEELSIENGPGITVTDTEFYPSFLYRSGDRTDLFAPSSGSVLAVLHLSIENQTEEKIRVGADSFAIPNGDVITSISNYSVSLSDFREPDGQPLDRTEIGPNETGTGWILADVPYEQVTSGLQLTWDRSLYSSTPEASWTFGSHVAPAFEISDFDFPNEVEIGTTATGSVTVQNTGDETGAFQGILERRDVGGHEWEQLETVTLEIEAGSEASWSTEIQEPYIGPSEYRFLPETTPRTIDFVPATRSFGDSYTTPEGQEISVSLGMMNFDGFDTEYTLDNWSEDTVTAESGNQFAFVNISVENTGPDPDIPPRQDAFSALVAGNEYSVFAADDWGRADFKSPITGSEYYPGGVDDPGEITSGWLVFQVPDDLSVEDLTVQYSPDEYLTAKWSG